MVTYTRPIWVKSGEQWSVGETQLQYEQKGGILAPGIASVLPVALPKAGDTRVINGEEFVWTQSANAPGYWSPTGRKKEISDEEVDTYYQETYGRTPTEDERETARKEAEEYYGYTIPTERAPAYYPVEKAEIETEAQKLETRAIEDYEYNLAQIEEEKKNLLVDYQQYLDDIETGKIRVGTDYQRQLENQLEEKRMWLEEQEASIRTNLEALHRGWIGKGALFAGPRFQAAREYTEATGRERERYMTGWEYGKETAETTYERAMEDYLTKTGRAGIEKERGLAEITSRIGRYETLKQRGLGDIALAKIKDIRSLQEKYSEAIAKRMGMTLGEQWGY